MKILHLISEPFGGAANAAIRLHNALIESGFESRILTVGYRKDVEKIYSFANINRFGWIQNPIKKYKSNKYYFNTKNKLEQRKPALELFSFISSPFNIVNDKNIKWADIINLHWISQFVDYKTFFTKIEKPIVWTLHDMNPFTGGCHYSFDCKKYIIPGCTNCFQLDGLKEDYAREVFNEKSKIYSLKEIHIVVLSNWLKQESEQSVLFSKYKHHLIPNSVDSKVFYSRNRKKLIEKYSLLKNKKLILFVADSVENYRKGVKYIIEASKFLNKKYHFVLVGKGAFKADNFTHLGQISDENRMAEIYSLADVFVIPSLADNLPNTVLESLFCGTPVVGFNVGGIPDMVEDRVNGFVCNEIDATKLADTINIALQTDFNRVEISKQAQEKYSLIKQAAAYLKLYKSLLKT